MGRMKIDVYSIMRNEEVILPYFLRHYEKIADRIFVFEDNSTDNTLKILMGHPKVVLLDVNQHGINETYWTEELWPQYEIFSRGRADWVMCVDADEFVYHPKLMDTLEAQKFIKTDLLFCRGYTLVSDVLPTTDGQIYDEIKMGLPDRWSGKWAVFSPEIYLRYGQGRHTVKEHSDARAESKTGIKLLHYRYLGPQYFESRDIKNTESYNNAEHQGLVYNPKRRRNLPDQSRGIPLEWFAEHKVEAVNVVDI